MPSTTASKSHSKKIEQASANINNIIKRSLMTFFKMTYLFGLLSSFSFTLGIPYLIESIEITKNKVTVTTEKAFQKKYLTQPFFVAYDTNINLLNLDSSIVTIPFIMNVIPVVWLSNKKYLIESMDEDLYHSLEIIQKVFKIFYPSNKWNGQLIPNKLIKNVTNKTESQNSDSIGAMFSHGLDAVYTSMSNADKKQLLITVWGSDVAVDNTKLWSHVQKKCSEFAHANKQEHNCIQSNFVNFLQWHQLTQTAPDIPTWWGYTMQGVGYTGLTAPLLAYRGISHLLLAASHTREFPYPYGSHPLIDNNITFAGIHVTHDGPINRTEKIHFIKEL